MLEDKTTTEILYGGACSGGKSYLACAWIIIKSLQYPGTRWIIGRARLASLKKSTLKTFLELIRQWGLTDYINYNANDNVIKFTNGSEVLLMDLFQQPSDTDFVKLGSIEITGYVIDEVAEVSEQAFNILNSRVRYKLKEYNLKPKALLLSNPTRNWLYRNFYKLHMENNLPDYRKYVQSLPTDNKHIPDSYIQQLEKLDEVNKQRLLFGNWDFSSDDLDLFVYENIIDCFDNGNNLTGTRYITLDVADSGADKSCLIVWHGLTITEIHIMSQTEDRVQEFLEQKMKQFNILRSNTIVDANGLGVGISNRVKCVAFKSQEKAINGENYSNIKAQCVYKLADYVNNTFINILDKKYIEKITEELMNYKRWKVDLDGKAQITPKSEIKKAISRSPDIADSMLMRMSFELKKVSNTRTSFIKF